MVKEDEEEKVGKWETRECEKEECFFFSSFEDITEN